MTSRSIQQLMHDAASDFDDLKIRPYSSRGMFGAICIAVTGPHDEVTEFHNKAVLSAFEDAFDAALEAQDAAEKLAANVLFKRASKGMDWFNSYKSDSMGLDQVRYWPHLKFCEDGESAEVNSKVEG